MKKLLISIPLMFSVAFAGLGALAVTESAMAYPVKVCKNQCVYSHGKTFCFKKCKFVDVNSSWRGGGYGYGKHINVYHQNTPGKYINVYKTNTNQRHINVYP